jgi:hypothetical protein
VRKKNIIKKTFMKKLFYSLFAILVISIVACNNEGKDTAKSNDPQKALADSLEKEVMHGHDVAMPKSMKIPDIQKEVTRIVDSIGKLPAKAQQAATPYRKKLDSLLIDLSYADEAMNRWMVEYKYDSAKNNIEQRIKYLADEKLKVVNVKRAVLGSLQKADSLLKAKF